MRAGTGVQLGPMVRKLTWYTLTLEVQDSGRRVNVASIGMAASSSLPACQNASKSAGSVCVGWIFSGAKAAVAAPLYFRPATSVVTVQRRNPGTCIVPPSMERPASGTTAFCSAAGIISGPTV